MRYLISGTAGFIGYHLAKRLLSDGHSVHGIDGITPYYDQVLKRARHAGLAQFPAFSATEAMLENANVVAHCVGTARAEIMVHLAAQAGVRYSQENPRSYIESNITGTFNLLEALRAHPCRHVIIASTSSVYGASSQQPFDEEQSTDRPVSLYAATKKSVEVLAFNYAHLHKLPTTVARFFTVYGPWGRPDMALFKFTRNILSGSPIDVYGAGKMTRDFTYVADVVEALSRLAALTPTTGPGIAPDAPYRIVNIGSNNPIRLEDFIATIEQIVGRKAIRKDLPMQPGDVPATWASTARLEQLTGFKPACPLAQGVREFVDWYRDYYRV
jgi:UDP-glucuronate 4-epimerase